MNSLVAFSSEGQPKTVKGKDGKNSLIPSVIHFRTDHSVLVGDEAREKLISAPRVGSPLFWVSPLQIESLFKENSISVSE